jgi:hypothetical protein
VHKHDHKCASGQNWWMHQMSPHEYSVVPEKGVWDCWVPVTPPHHQNTLVRPEGFDDMQEHKCSVIKGALGWPIMIMRYWKAIAVIVGWGEIKDVMIRPGGLAAASNGHTCLRTEQSNSCMH